MILLHLYLFETLFKNKYQGSATLVVIANCMILASPNSQKQRLEIKYLTILNFHKPSLHQQHQRSFLQLCIFLFQQSNIRRISKSPCRPSPGARPNDENRHRSEPRPASTCTEHCTTSLLMYGTFIHNLLFHNPYPDQMPRFFIL